MKMTKPFEMQQHSYKTPNIAFINRRGASASIRGGGSGNPFIYSTYKNGEWTAKEQPTYFSNLTFPAASYLVATNAGANGSLVFNVMFFSNTDDVAFFPITVGGSYTPTQMEVIFNNMNEDTDLSDWPELDIPWNTRSIAITSTNPLSGLRINVNNISNLTKVTISVTNGGNIFDSQDNALAFIASLPEGDGSTTRTLDLSAVADSDIKTAMQEAAEAKKWTVVTTASASTLEEPVTTEQTETVTEEPVTTEQTETVTEEPVTTTEQTETVTEDPATTTEQ